MKPQGSKIKFINFATLFYLVCDSLNYSTVKFSHVIARTQYEKKFARKNTKKVQIFMIKFRVQFIKFELNLTPSSKVKFDKFHYFYA